MSQRLETSARELVSTRSSQPEKRPFTEEC